MKNVLLLITGFLLLSSCKKDPSSEQNISSAGSIYFPPIGNTIWATTSPESLGWNTGNLPALYSFLEDEQTKAFLVLKDGKIVLEKYFGQTIQGNAPFTQNSLWYWASAGKTLTNFIVGKAQQEGHLNISNPTSQYLGNGWTSVPPAKEALITVRHQLTMTSGLDDGTGDANNTAPQALVYKADAGTRWAYHNASYTLLQKVVANATGQSFSTYFDAKLKSRIGMDGQWMTDADNSNVYWSTPRSMARFGILMLAKGKWENADLLGDSSFFNASVTASQSLNLSYGYLWWLNGKESAMLPQSQVVFPTSLCPKAPADMFSAMGKNGQLLSIIPSKGLVVVRMGHNTDGTYVPVQFQNNLWEKLDAVIR
ncbi:MAG TPA: serine hydrolase [Flavisolibacter sp.]|jgi:CubicO group peptidase (beta-lactamase class C family)|nr:serine hydrolase [Flavisolibacter sp.]